MARWKPSDSVGRNEQIGRRLFEEPMLKGAAGQPSFSGLLLSHFEETRGNEVSLDRLGASGLDRKVLAYLQPRGSAAGKLFAKPKAFDGWATVSAKELMEASREPRLPVFASPIVASEPSDNAYHAHVVTPDGTSSHMMALHLRHIFTSKGGVHSVRPPETPPRGILAKVGEWFSALVRPNNEN